MENNKNSFNPLDYPLIFSYPERLTLPSPWVEHIPFAFYIVSAIKPKKIIELGTYKGNSYCAFCQAVKELSLDTKCYAVDTWRGDKHGGYFGDEILTELRQHHDVRYGTFSELIQATFDDAVNQFLDNEIDLLHIDGLHTYEAVKHDFEMWHAKLSDSAVVLFHDIAVKENDFGVWKFWEEIRQAYPSFEFFFGNGLGVLAVGKDYPANLNLLFATNDSHIIQNFFFSQGENLEKNLTNLNLNHMLNEKENQLKAQFKAITDRDQSIQDLKDLLAHRDQDIQTLNNAVNEKSRIIEVQEQEIQNLNNAVSEKAQTIQVQEQKAQSLSLQLQENEKSLFHLKQQRDLLAGEVTKYVTSTSWRITRPLRKIKKRFIK